MKLNEIDRFISLTTTIKMTTKEEKEKRTVDYVAQQRNWEQRVVSENESPHKWNETWGELFEKIEVPFDYEKRIEYLQAKLKRLPTSSAHAPPKVYRNK